MASVSDKVKQRKRIVRLMAVALIALALLFVAVGVYVFLLWKNGARLNRETMFTAGQTETITFEREPAGDAPTPAETPVLYEGQPTIKHGDTYYIRNEDIFSILFMGVDTDDDGQFADIGVTAHQADSLILAVINPEENTLAMVNIPRMTIAEVKQLDPAFNYARTTKSPICIQYAFGDGKELSCNLTREAVSRLLFNIPISRYISMNLDGLYKVNDAIGGVTVTLLDDMTAANPKMKKGLEYTLNGKDAQLYLQGRTGKGLDGTNASRMKRHIQYYKAFFLAAKNKLKVNPMFAVNLYSSMGGSIQTDLSMDEMIYLSKVVVNMDITDENTFTLEGTTKNEDFFADDAALKDLLIRLFYTEVAQ